MKIISIRDNPEYANQAIRYFQKCWASEQSEAVYEDSILCCLASSSPLPQWYLLLDAKNNITGCAGLITNDFISRMDLWPWLCALYIEEDARGHGFSTLLIARIQADARRLGFDKLYLCSDLSGFYERFGFRHIGTGYHPWGESSRIYECSLSLENALGLCPTAASDSGGLDER